ncbi:putative DBINO protein [Hordeum vulgare]|nr:putative DBINO protein [Hordeum vulgare]
MADAHPNSGGSTVDQPGIAKKKKAPRKPWAEFTPEEIAKLDVESAKRRNRRAVVKDNAAARKFAAERDAMEAARRKIEVVEKEAIVSKAHALLMLGICRPAGFSATAVGPANTGSSVAPSPHYQSPTLRTMVVSPDNPPPRHDAHTRFSGSPDVSVIAPSTPRPSPCIDLNVAPRSSSGGRASVEMQRKQARPPFAGTMSSPRVLFDEMATPMPPVDDTYDQFMEDVIYNDGHVPA